MTFIYSSPEPTKMCKMCGGTFEFKHLTTDKNYKDGVRPLCRPCKSIKQNGERRRFEEKQKRLVQSLKSNPQPKKEGLVPPRTFNHLKDPECWTGHTDRYYVRNDGNKNIASKGMPT